MFSRENNPSQENCLLLENSYSVSRSIQSQIRQEFYHKSNFVYFIRKEENNWSNLIILDPETESEEIKVLETKELDGKTCMTWLPDNKFFCFGGENTPGLALVIDENHAIRKLPSGEPCFYSSSLYFNRNLYCFGGKYNNQLLLLSSRFDLEKNRWIKLTPLPLNDCHCHSVLFNENILISGFYNRNLLLYSIDIDSFSIIPHLFRKWSTKIFVNAEERLYLIEHCGNGSIYENGIGDEYTWNKIAKLPRQDNPYLTYYSYNKGIINIGFASYSSNIYCKFDLDKKIIIETKKD